MGFTDKMRASLGAEGARIEVQPPAGATTPGASTDVEITIVGGTRTAHVDRVVVRLVEAERHWVAADGTMVSEDEAQALPDRRHLTASWTRTTVGEQRVSVDVSVEAGERHRLQVAVDVPTSCKPTSPACSHTLNVQADIKGQIDPTGNARFSVA